MACASIPVDWSLTAAKAPDKLPPCRRSPASHPPPFHPNRDFAPPPHVEFPRPRVSMIRSDFGSQVFRVRRRDDRPADSATPDEPPETVLASAQILILDVVSGRHGGPGVWGGTSLARGLPGDPGPSVTSFTTATIHDPLPPPSVPSTSTPTSTPGSFTPRHPDSPGL